MLNITTGGVSLLSQEIGYMCVFVSLFFFVFMLHLCLTGIPDCSEEDLSVARALNLTWTTVLKSHKDGTQTLVNSDEVSTVNDDSVIIKL